MTDDRIIDGDEAYALSEARHAVDDEDHRADVPSIAQLTRWMEDAPTRARLRDAVARAGGGPLDANLPDPELFELLRGRIVEGHLHLTRVSLRRGYGARELVPLEDGAGGEDLGDVIDENAPCDFEIVVLKCKHMPDANGFRTLSDARFFEQDGTPTNNLPSSASRGSVLEVIGASVDRGADDITITLEGGPGYACGNTHPHIDVTDQTGWSDRRRGETSMTFKAKCRDLPPPASAYANPWQLIVYYFFPEQTTNVYTIDVASCGRLGDGSMGFGRSQPKVRVYPSDVFELKLEIPPFGKKQYTRSRMTRPDGTVANRREWETQNLLANEQTIEGRTEMVGPSGYTSEDDFSYQTGQGGLSETTKTVTGGERTVGLKETQPVRARGTQIAKGFSFTRNGADVKGTSALGEMIEAIVELERNIQEVMNFIREFQPQVGWKFVFEIEIFKGELKVEWGYKEWEDHTVFKWWKFSVGMKLFAVKLEVSFGAEFKVKGFGVTALVFGNVSVDAGVEASKEGTPRSSPWTFAVKAEPKGELGVRAALGSDWVTATGKLTVGLEWSGDLKCGPDDPFHCDWVLDFKGVKTHVVGRVRWVGSFEREWTILEPRRRWKTGRFPGRVAA